MKFFLKFVLLVLVGLGLSLSWLSERPSFIEKVQHTFIALAQEACNAKVRCTLSHLSLLQLSATFTDLSIEPVLGEKPWACSAKKVAVSCSLWPLLRLRKVGLRCVLQGLEISSDCIDNHCALVDHFGSLRGDDAKAPVLLQSLDVASATVHLYDPERDYTFEARLKGNAQCKETQMNFLMDVQSGDFFAGKKKIMTSLSGAVTAAVAGTELESAACDMTCALHEVFEKSNTYYFSGAWKNKKGTALFHNHERSLLVSPCTFEYTKDGLVGTVQMAFPLKDLVHCIHPLYAAQVVGSGTAQVKGVIGGKIEGQVRCVGIGWGAQKLEKVESSFVRASGGNIQGFLQVEHAGQAGGLQWAWNDHKKRARFAGSNTTALTLFGTAWEIPPEKIGVRGTLNADLTGQVVYRARAENKKTDSCVALHGEVVRGLADWKHTGTLLTNESEYSVDSSGSPFSLVLSQDGQKPLVEINTVGSLCFAKIEADFIKSLLKEYGDVDCLVKGTVLCQASLQDNAVIEGSINFQEGIVKNPAMYNFIHGLQSDFLIDSINKQFVFKDLNITLQKGSIESSAIKCGYDSVRSEWWGHAPFLFKDCFINWKKDLYVLFSGAVIAQKRYGQPPELTGFITLDKSQLKENIFSPATQQELINLFVSPPSTTPDQGVAVNLALSTRVPLVIKTPQLETNALLALSCQGVGTQTELKGDIFFQGGMIHFPAYSLPLIKGKLSFAGDSTADPVIELVAQGHVKKYVITLCVGGTGQDPQIVFDSSPSLSEEQIMMLLIAGSQEGSLNSIAPALVMRNVEAVIFGASYRTRNETWLEPLKHIKFVPKFTDQTGRGGFKGAIEIEVNNRLRGSIEKNFSLTEDVAFEVEYDLTDEVSVKGGVDERGDLGAQLEMRFKF